MEFVCREGWLAVMTTHVVRFGLPAFSLEIGVAVHRACVGCISFKLIPNVPNNVCFPKALCAVEPVVMLRRTRLTGSGLEVEDQAGGHNTVDTERIYERQRI